MEFRYDFSDGRSDMIYDSVEGESLDVLTVRMIREADRTVLPVKDGGRGTGVGIFVSL